MLTSLVCWLLDWLIGKVTVLSTVVNRVHGRFLRWLVGWLVDTIVMMNASITKEIKRTKAMINSCSLLK